MDQNAVLIARAMCIALNQDPDKSVRLRQRNASGLTEIGPLWRDHVKTAEFLVARKPNLSAPADLLAVGSEDGRHE